MKGLMMSIGLFVMSMGVSLGLMYYVSFETLRQDTVFALKQSLTETMLQLDELKPALRNDQALSLFIDNFKVRKKSSVHYQIDLMGFIADPLAVRIRLKVHDDGALFDLKMNAEETMIEVTNE